MSPQILTGIKHVWGETNHISAFNLCYAPDSVDMRRGLSISDVPCPGYERHAYSSARHVRRSIIVRECVYVCACVCECTLNGSFAGGPKVPPQSTSMTAVVFITNIHSQTHKCTQTVLSHIRTDPKRQLQMPDYDISTLAETKWMCVWKHVGVSLREAFATQTERQSALMSRITVDHTPETCKQVQFTKCYCKRSKRGENVCVCVCVCVCEFVCSSPISNSKLF